MSAARCPICCTQAANARYRPFCSSRCADVDLHRWLVGAYAIPMQDEPDTGLSDAEGGRGNLAPSPLSHSAHGELPRETE